MVFLPNPRLGQMPDVPDSVPLCDFILDETYGRRRIAESLNPFVCALTARSITAQQQKDDVAALSRTLAKALQWKVNEGSEYDKVAVIFAQNLVDIMTLTWLYID
ncbi:hypothetical protein CLAIMM_01457 [Cladophialophora immunda]|nr:hypothetical protein CLAIMM_01457 [Cladophialophora immunda]